MPKPDQSVVKSAARTLEIFEYFDEARRPAHIQEVALALGYPHSSTAALLRSLADLGYLEFSVEDKTYFPSIRVSLLGHWVGDEVLPLRRIQQQMRDIAEQTQMTVVLGAVSGGYCQYVRVIEGTTPIRYHVKAGTRQLKAADCVVIVTDHSAYDYTAIVRDAPLVVDTRNATRNVPKKYRAKIIKL